MSRTGCRCPPSAPEWAPPVAVTPRRRPAEGIGTGPRCKRRLRTDIASTEVLLCPPLLSKRPRIPPLADEAKCWPPDVAAGRNRRGARSPAADAELPQRALL